MVPHAAWLVVLLSLLAMPVAAADAPAAIAPLDYGLEHDVDALMARYQGAVPGASVLVLKDGQPLLAKAYGLAELETGRASNASTNYRLASITKQFTAAAVLLLAEDGRLSVEQRVRQWLPELPEVLDEVTLHHLLSHTSGILAYEELMAPDASEQVHDEDVLALLEAHPGSYFAPGARWRYSNSGYALLALVVERASGQAFADFLAARIFRPLGMEATVAHRDGVSSVPVRAFGYSQVNGAWRRTDQSPTSAVLGDGGIYSSITDLARWDAALYDERLLADASRRRAFAAAVPSDDPGVAYGYGWRISGETLWHSGESIGFRNVLVRWPGERLTVVILSNRNAPEPYPLALAIAGLVRGHAAPHAP